MQCRSMQNSSFSAILKKLNIKLGHLNRDTNESVIRSLRPTEIQLGLYQHSEPLVPDAVVLSLPVTAMVHEAPALAERGDTAAVAATVPVPELGVDTTP
jgi:hypothetical protein